MPQTAQKQEPIRISVRRELIEQTRLRLSYERRLRFKMQTAFAEIGAQAQKEYQGAGHNLDARYLQSSGRSSADIGANIFERMRGSFSRIRAATIARTETHTAASYANHQVNASLNIPDQVKRWVSVADDRTRSFHREMNGTEVPLDEDFVVPYKGLEYRMGYTGDPRGGAHNTINCRCVTLYVSPEDEVVD